MEEKMLIVGKHSKKLHLLYVVIGGLGLICLALFLIMYLLNVGYCRTGFTAEFFGVPEEIFNQAHEFANISFLDLIVWKYPTCLSVSIALDLGIILTFVGFLLYLSLSKVSITVTNKRVYGISTWGKRVDLPLDSISAVVTSALKGIAVATSSGIIKFKAIENYKEIHKAVSNLLVERQNTSWAARQVEKTEPHSNADELKKYKELLDTGVITQEEFDAKKKQLLGL